MRETLHFAPISFLPNNLAEFVEEIGPRIGEVFGDAAGHHYRKNALISLSTTILGRQVQTWGAFDGSHVAALLFVQDGPARLTLSFLHTLQRYGTSDAATRLVEAFLAHPDHTERTICTDYLPLDDLNHQALFENLGFSCKTRQLMSAMTAKARIGASTSSFNIHPAQSHECDSFAQVLSDTYPDSPSDHFLFPEVSSMEHARAFVAEVWTGTHGTGGDLFSMGAWSSDGACKGILLATQPYPETGFIIHLAVPPSGQNQGIGGDLLGAAIGKMREEGLKRVLLGVNTDSPAVRLYQRYGFQPVHALPVSFRIPAMLNSG